LRNPWEGEEDAERLVELAHRKVQHKHDLLVQALEGQMRPHHRFLLHELLGLIEALDRSIVHVEQEIAHRLRPFDEPLPRLEAITGVSRRILEVLFAEVGWDESLPRCSTSGFVGRDDALYHAPEYPWRSQEELERKFLGHWLT
jgi:hypothetical protein